MAYKSSIVLQKTFPPGICCICGAAASMKWRDGELDGGMQTDASLVGDCCFGHLLQADKSLNSCKFLTRPTSTMARNNE